MSSDSLSDSGTSEIRTIEKLIEENRMKDLALQKASNLIELLTVELSAEKQSKSFELDKLEAFLRQSYQPQISSMIQKMNFLELQLSRVTNSSTEYEKKQKNQVSRNLFRSFGDSQPKSSVSINRQYSQNSAEKQTQIDLESLSKLQKQIFFQQITKISEFQHQVTQQLNTTYLQENLQLSIIRKYVQNVEVDFQEVFQALPECVLPSKMKTLEQIIKSQRQIINEMRSLIQEMQQDHQDLILRMQSIYNGSIFNADYDFRLIDQAVARTKSRMVEKGRGDKLNLLQLELENRELKAIVQRMIDLIQVQRQSKLNYHA